MLSMDLLVVPGTTPVAVAATLDLAEAVTRSHHGPDHAPVDVRVVGGDSGIVALRGGMFVPAVPVAQAGPARPWVVVPGIGNASAGEMERRLAGADVQAAVEWLAKAIDSRVAASCTGTFVAAEAGALGGRTVTTTWWLAGLFAARYPDCHLDADQMVVKDGPVLTAGAAMAHLDLLFAINEEVFGLEVARAIAARATAAPRASQAPFRRSVVFRDMDPDLAAIERYVLDRIDRPIRLADLASTTHLSARTLTRRVQAATGMSPIQFAQRIKVEAALDLLSDARRSVTEVAHAVGLADASTLNRLIRRTTGRSPGTFRSA
ncbi:GlxA family transcriptional regulator [Nocardia brasiliensis]|uniref:GlxA family transcriptional regulator n=1 Tax=Nocardia brasiliensis TaxID=37326 RepID=UPI002456B7C0|nr:helix-turn-helix domain-containing protein [Nocardia brasiliensis]